MVTFSLLLLCHMMYIIKADDYLIKVLHAEGDLSSYSDLYVRLSYVTSGERIGQTQQIRPEQESEWNEEFLFCDEQQPKAVLYQGDDLFIGQIFFPSDVIDQVTCDDEYGYLAEMYPSSISVFFEFTKDCNMVSGKRNDKNKKDKPGKNKHKKKSKAGIFGEYPLHGGNKMKQQIGLNSDITIDNVKNLEVQCIHEQKGIFGYMGYPLVDDDENVYFVDDDGYNSVDLLTCKLNWKITLHDLETMLGECTDCIAPVVNTPALIKTENGDKAVLISYLAWEYPMPSIPMTEMTDYPRKGTYLAALRVEDGSILWNTTIWDKHLREASVSISHGVQVDGKYAYGGTANHGYGLPVNVGYFGKRGPFTWRGKVYKVDINTGEVVNDWYSLPEFDFDHLQTEEMYNGASMYPHAAVIDDYFVFGTSNIWNHPQRVEDCLLGDEDAVPLEDANHYDACGNDRRDNPINRCLEKGVHSLSIIVLNKHTFELMLSVPTQGASTWGNNCYDVSNNLHEMSKADADKYWWNNPFCSKFSMFPEHIQEVLDALGSPSSAPGINGDVNGVAGFYHDGTPYAAVSSKNGFFWVIDLKKMEVVMSREVAPWGNAGGASPFSMAIDEENMIAIYTERGDGKDAFDYTYTFADGNVGCGAGIVRAINLLTGQIIWEWVHPFIKLNEECFDDCMGIGFDCHDIMHFDWDWGQCEMGINKTAKVETKTIYVEKKEEGMKWEERRGSMIGPSNINNGMVFIPTMTGEIYVHNVLDGSFITVFYCPEYQYKETVDGNVIYTPNREGTRSGQTMFRDYMIFYCGAPYVHPVDNDAYWNNLLQQGSLVIMKLNSTTNDGSGLKSAANHFSQRPLPDSSSDSSDSELSE